MNETERLASNMYNKVFWFFQTYMENPGARATIENSQGFEINEATYRLHTAMELELQEGADHFRLLDLDNRQWLYTEDFKSMKLGNNFLSGKLFVGEESCHILMWDNDHFVVEFAYSQEKVEQFLKHVA